jgi:hypothetical protein
METNIFGVFSHLQTANVNEFLTMNALFNTIVHFQFTGPFTSQTSQFYTSAKPIYFL